MPRDEWDVNHLILFPIALFSSLSRRGLGTRIGSRNKAPPAKKLEKGYGKENETIPCKIPSHSSIQATVSNHFQIDWKDIFIFALRTPLAE